MATDIAFALGALVLIADTIPIGAKVFLTALAIADDMGAVVVIALFYRHALDWTALIQAALVFAALIAINVARVRPLAPYLLLGVLLWFFMHQSGVHPTLAGVLLAWAIPTRTRINASDFSAEARTLLNDFERTETGDHVVLTSKGQQEALLALGRASKDVTAPLLRLEHALHAFSAFGVMPLFALSNAGVSFRASAVYWPVFLGVALGLAVGKPLGIMAASYSVVSLKVSRLPTRVTWLTLLGCGCVGGIGFTMSLFIASLAFENGALLDSAKLGILTGSAIASVVGGAALRISRQRLATRADE
jgi:NhaA family Na+:H+ antiporter